MPEKQIQFMSLYAASSARIAAVNWYELVKYCAVKDEGHKKGMNPRDQTEITIGFNKEGILCPPGGGT